MLLKLIPWIIGLLILGFNVDYCQMTSQSSGKSFEIHIF